MAGVTGVCPLASDNATFTNNSIIIEGMTSHVVSTVIAVRVTLVSTTVAAAVWPVWQGGHTLLARCRVRRYCCCGWANRHFPPLLHLPLEKSRQSTWENRQFFPNVHFPCT